MTAENKSRIIHIVRKEAAKTAHISKRLQSKYDFSMNNRSGKIVIKKKK